MVVASPQVASGYPDLLFADFDLGQSLSLQKDGYLSLGPVVMDNITQLTPYPFYSDRELVMNQRSQPMSTNKKIQNFPRLYLGWIVLKQRHEPKYMASRERVGIYEFIQLTTHEIKPCNALLEDALNY